MSDWKSAECDAYLDALFPASMANETTSPDSSEVSSRPSCDAAFDKWYAAQSHQLTNEQLCRLIWQRGWQAHEKASMTDAAQAAFDEKELMRLVREFAEVVYGLRHTTDDVGRNLVNYFKSLTAPTPAAAPVMNAKEFFAEARRLDCKLPDATSLALVPTEEERDAARYRWIRAGENNLDAIVDGDTMLYGACLDHAIDTEISAAMSR